MNDFALSVRHTFADALQIVRETHSEKPHRTGLRVAILQAMAGDYGAAIHTAQSIANRGARDNALGRVAVWQSGRGLLDAALDTAAQITAQGEREDRIAAIALDATGQKRFAEAVTIAQRLAGIKRDHLLSRIAGRMHDAGDAGNAWRVIQQIAHREPRVCAESSFWTQESRNAPVETKVSFAR